jgi:curved DNA-binding protein CbpA
MVTDLYDLLGIAHDATTVEIRRAYRAKSKLHHPDAGGDRKMFDLIKLAEDVLTDPERRKRYDRTGTAEETAPDNAVVAVQEYLFAAVEAFLSKINRAKFGTTDVLGGVRAELRNRIADRLQMIRDAEANAAEVKVLADRFAVADDGRNWLHRMLMSRHDDVLKSCDNAKRECELAEKALLEIARYSYRQDAPSVPGLIMPSSYEMERLYQQQRR